MQFADMPLPATIQTALATHGYAEATGVQEAVVATGSTGKDLLVSSRTGSGKTVAFGLAMLPRMLDEAGKVDSPAGKPRALVIAPTRELAQQVARELTWLGKEALRPSCSMKPTKCSTWAFATSSKSCSTRPPPVVAR